MEEKNELRMQNQSNLSKQNKKMIIKKLNLYMLRYQLLIYNNLFIQLINN
jgi:hypothetical protein